MPKNNLHIVEIGPGLGDLTCKILEQKRVVKAYEIDKRMESFLTERFENEIEKKQFELFITDVLDVWQTKSLHDQKYDIVANLPYNVATNLILRAFKDDNCSSILVMIQKEVAEKFNAKNGSKEFGSLSVIAQSLCNVKMICDVPPNSFEPPPKVTSSVILFEKKDIFDKSFEPIYKSNLNGFEKFLKVAFLQPRKRAIKNLTTAYKKEAVQKAFIDLDLDQNIRPHQISTSTFHLIFQNID
jgi:16S rRNA (adenine1518-N6/adenine1519-N6)-dimethyltransferase